MHHVKVPVRCERTGTRRSPWGAAAASKQPPMQCGMAALGSAVLMVSPREIIRRVVPPLSPFSYHACPHFFMRVMRRLKHTNLTNPAR